MIVLYIIAAVIGIIAILFLCRVYIVLSYSEEDGIMLLVRYTFWRMRLVPSKSGKIKLGDYTYEKTHKSMSDKKKKKKKEPAAKKPRKKKKPDEAESLSEGSEKKEKSVVSMLLEMRGIIFDLLKAVPRKLRLEIKRLHISVGAADAAATAITYGAVTQAVGATLTLAEEHADVRVKRGCVMVTPDFLSGKISADVGARLSIRVGSVVGLALRFVFSFIKLEISNIKE